MFANCFELTNAPDLPAETLVTGCYNNMFGKDTGKDNNKISSITCLAINISATDCVKGWVSGINITDGAFIKNPNMTSWTTGVNGIPTGWTVEDYDEEQVEE